MDNLFKRIKSLLDKLSSKPRIDGLQLSDAGLEYVFFEYEKPKTVALRLPPGILKNGKLEDSAQFLGYVKKLHDMILPNEPEKMLRVTVALPAALVYTQSFNIPNVGADKIKETAELNLQMISPIPVANANMGAQIIGETPDRYDLLGAFVDKNDTGRFRDLLAQGGFSPVALEFPALALTRVIDQLTKLNQNSTLVAHVSSEGLSIIILRNGKLYFNYFRSWQSIQGDARAISRPVFDAEVIDEVRKVINFSVSRFHETPSGAFVVAPGFESEIVGLLEKNFGLRAVPLVLNDIAPVFYVALGAALRGRMELGEGELKIVNLGGEDLVNNIYNDQILNFLSLWRNIIVGVFSIMLVTFILAASFLVSRSKDLANQLNEFTYSGRQQELADLTAKVSEFNTLVSTIKSVRGNSLPWYDVLNHLGNVAEASHVKLKSVNILSLNSPISLFGTAADYNTVLDFKNTLSSDPEFLNVNLPLTQISIAPDNSVSFNLSFQFNVSR